MPIEIGLVGGNYYQGGLKNVEKHLFRPKHVKALRLDNKFWLRKARELKGVSDFGHRRSKENMLENKGQRLKRPKCQVNFWEQDQRQFSGYWRNLLGEQ